VVNFTFAPGALFDPEELISSADNFGWALNGFAAGVSNKTAGFEYHVSTVGYGQILLTWSERHSATGSKYMRVQYTTNGTDYLDGDVITFNEVLYQNYSSDLSGKAGVANNPNFGFRVVAEWESTATGGGNPAYAGTTGAFGSGGTIREDLMTVWGSSGTTSPVLNLQLAGSKIILTWSDPLFALQAAPNVGGTYTNVPGATSPYTNAIVPGDPTRFFRLLH
jgi:hypothetical protein